MHKAIDREMNVNWPEDVEPFEGALARDLDTGFVMGFQDGEWRVLGLASTTQEEEPIRRVSTDEGKRRYLRIQVKSTPTGLKAT